MLIFHRPCVVASVCAVFLAGCAREPRVDAARPPVGTDPAAMVAPAPALAAGSTAAPAGAGSAPTLDPPLALTYPRAPWRLAEPTALVPVVLSFSQIVIRHADVRAEVSFNLAYWKSVAVPARSRAEALALAGHVAESAAREPGRFPELARQYSEDLPSRDEGGALGAYSAIQMSPWPQVLDALSALKPGQTSKVVETPYGFHVFHRDEPAQEERRSGAHIVIGHDQAPWLSVFARGDRPRRTREAALSLANEIYRQAEAHPERFAELVQRHSEHRDAIADGDFGDWSTREASAFPPRTKRLGELAVGQVGRPIETHLGFEIIERTAPRPRTLYRAAVLRFPVFSIDGDAPAPPSATQRADALREAEAMAQRLSRDPAAFDALDTDVVQWEEGRANPDLARALSQLSPGQITVSPVDSEDGFLIAQRLEPEPVASARFESELPEPEPADLHRLLASLPPRDALTFLRAFAATVAGELSLDRATAERLDGFHRFAGSSDPGSRSEARLEQLIDLFDRTHGLLGNDRYAHYQAALSREAAARLSPVDSERSPLGL
jgi:parvulin-like peptidyl-prolyl isomerase